MCLYACVETSEKKQVVSEDSAKISYIKYHHKSLKDFSFSLIHLKEFYEGLCGLQKSTKVSFNKEKMCLFSP